MILLVYWMIWKYKMQMFLDRKSTRLNSSHANISYAVFCLKKKKIIESTVHPENKLEPNRSGADRRLEHQCAFATRERTDGGRAPDVEPCQHLRGRDKSHTP